MDFEEKGYLFVGHSEAGKSTITKIFGDEAKILCDDRNIVRKWPEGFRVHGTWSHGEIPIVSPDSAPLRGIFFLEKSDHVQIVKVNDKKIIAKKILACIIRPVATNEWWDKILDLVELIAEEIPCHILHFDRSKKVVEAIRSL